MELKGWIIYDLEGNFLANRSKEIVSRQIDEDKEDGLICWEGEGCRMIPITIDIPDVEAKGTIKL